MSAVRERGGAPIAGRRALDRSVGNATVYAASPIVGRLFRIVVGGQVDSQRANTTNTPFVLGGANGMRGYEVNEFIGTTALVAHIEIRTMALAIWSQRIGGALFYDVGDAAPSFAQLNLHNDVGLGVRWLIPQLNSTVIRIDWAGRFRTAPSRGWASDGSPPASSRCSESRLFLPCQSSSSRVRRATAARSDTLGWRSRGDDAQEISRPQPR